MTVVYDITHETRYLYASPAHSAVMLLCLRPADMPQQRVLDFAISTEPSTTLHATSDPFGNTRHLLTLRTAAESLRIVSRSRIERGQPTRRETAPSGAWETIRSWRDSFQLWDYLKPSALTAETSPQLERFIDKHSLTPGEDPLADLHRLSVLLHDVFQYTPGSTTVESTIDHILETGAGVCQDYAHVMIAIARGWGVPARYAMGYLHVTGAEGEQAPSTATHAWVECLLPDMGWVGFDPTNRALADERHVLVAVGRDFHDVSPTRGLYVGRGDVAMETDVRVQTLGEKGQNDA